MFNEPGSLSGRSRQADDILRWLTGLETMSPLVVVLCGAPGSGKTISLAHLQARLCQTGTRVVKVPENATYVLGNCPSCSFLEASTQERVQVQRSLLNFHMAQEEALIGMVRLNPPQLSIVLMDCCTLTAKVYGTDEQWQAVRALPGSPALAENDLFARSDVVVRLETGAIAPADGQYEGGPDSRNLVRPHDAEQAGAARAVPAGLRCVSWFLRRQVLRRTCNEAGERGRIAPYGAASCGRGSFAWSSS